MTGVYLSVSLDYFFKGSVSSLGYCWSADAVVAAMLLLSHGGCR
jgi:hypothetical protein